MYLLASLQMTLYFFFTFLKKWVGQAMGNETFYGDGLSDLIIVLPLYQVRV